jgi:hypothetical protein
MKKKKKIRTREVQIHALSTVILINGNQYLLIALVSFC